MFSQKTKYALRVVLLLSLKSDTGDKVSGQEVAKNLKVPAAFTGKILQELARKNIVSSVKGPGGGFYLSKQNRKKPLLEIVKAMDDMQFFTSCGLGLTECSETHPCPVHDDFKAVRNKLLHLFASKTINEISDEIVKRNLFLVR